MQAQPQQEWEEQEPAGEISMMETLSSTYTDANKNPLNTTMPHPTSLLLSQAWIKPQSLIQCQVKKKKKSLCQGFFQTSDSFLLSWPFTFLFWWTILSLKDWKQKWLDREQDGWKTLSGFALACPFWTPHTPNLQFRRNGNSIGRQEHR